MNVEDAECATIRESFIERSERLYGEKLKSEAERLDSWY
jgi:hypothetical protein